MNPTTLLPLANAATKSLTVDPGLGTAAKLMSFGLSLKGIDLKNIQFITAPWKYDGSRIDLVHPDVDDLFAELRANRTLEGINASGKVAPKPTPAPTVDGTGHIRRVFNGTTTDGLGGKAADKLKADRFTVTGTTTATRAGPHHHADRVRLRRHRDQAQSLAKLFPGAQLVPLEHHRHQPRRRPGLREGRGRDRRRRCRRRSPSRPAARTPTPARSSPTGSAEGSAEASARDQLARVPAPPRTSSPSSSSAVAAATAVDGRVEDLAVVRGGGAEAADLADVLEGGGADVLVVDLVGHRRAEGLDASAHVSSVTRGSDKRPVLLCAAGVLLPWLPGADLRPAPWRPLPVVLQCSALVRKLS